MFKMWRDLDKKFLLTGHPATTATTRCLVLIAMLIFWWTYKYHLETHSRQRAFRAFFDIENEDLRVNFTYLAAAIRRIIEINSFLPENRNIEVISIARGFSPGDYGYKEVVDAVNEAIDSGIFVIPTSPYIFYDNFDVMALSRDVMNDPNDINSFRPGNWVMNTFISERNRYYDDVVFVPSGSRVNAFSDSPDSYEFSTGGGLSSVVPYIAGVYALAKQVKPDLEIDEFITLVSETALSNMFEYKKIKYSIRKIINPVGIINGLN